MSKKDQEGKLDITRDLTLDIKKNKRCYFEWLYADKFYFFGQNGKIPREYSFPKLTKEDIKKLTSDIFLKYDQLFNKTFSTKIQPNPGSYGFVGKFSQIFKE